MKFLLALFLFLVCFLNLKAQENNKLDSLNSLLINAKEDTGKVMLLLNMGEYYEKTKQDSAIYYLELASSLANKLKFVKGQYLYNEESAIVCFTKGNYQLAMDQSKKGLSLARELKDSNYVINM